MRVARMCTLLPATDEGKNFSSPRSGREDRGLRGRHEPHHRGAGDGARMVLLGSGASSLLRSLDRVVGLLLGKLLRGLHLLNRQTSLSLDLPLGGAGLLLVGLVLGAQRGGRRR